MTSTASDVGPRAATTEAHKHFVFDNCSADVLVSLPRQAVRTVAETRCSYDWRVPCVFSISPTTLMGCWQLSLARMFFVHCH